MASKVLIFGAAGAAIIGAMGIGAAIALHVMLQPPKAAFIDPGDPVLVLRGKPVYAANCAACHGAALQGQSDWRQRMPNGRLPAPPHDATGHTWHHPDGVLIDIVTNGLIPGRNAPAGYASDMPAYRDILSADDIRAVLAYIKSTWPAKVVQAQKEVTLQPPR